MYAGSRRENDVNTGLLRKGMMTKGHIIRRQTTKMSGWLGRRYCYCGSKFGPD